MIQWIIFLIFCIAITAIGSFYTKDDQLGMCILLSCAWAVYFTMFIAILLYGAFISFHYRYYLFPILLTIIVILNCVSFSKLKDKYIDYRVKVLEEQVTELNKKNNKLSNILKEKEKFIFNVKPTNIKLNLV